MNEGQILGNIFSLPQATDYSQGGAGGGARGSAPTMDDKYFGIPEAEKGLQVTGNIADKSRDYYQKLAGLRSLAQSMWSNYGIDVTRPDYGRPEAVSAAEMFKMELGNVLASANELKTSQDMLEQVNPIAAQGNYQFEQGAFDQPFATLTPEQQGYSTSVSDLAKLSTDKTSRTVDTQADYGKLAGQQRDSVKYYEDLLAKDPNNKNLQIQLEAVKKGGPNLKVDRGGSGLDNASTIANTITEIGDVIAGGHPTFQKTAQINPQTGSMYYSSSANPLIGKRIFGDDFVPVTIFTDGETVTAVNEKGEARPLDKNNTDAYARAVFKSTYQDKEYESLIGDLAKSGKLPMKDTPLGKQYQLTPEMMSSAHGNERASQIKQEAAQTKQAFEQYSGELKDIGDKLVEEDGLLRKWFPNVSSFFPNESVIQTELGTMILTERNIGKKDKYIDIALKDPSGRTIPLEPATKTTAAKNTLKVRDGAELVDLLKKRYDLNVFGLELVKRMQSLTEQPAVTQPITGQPSAQPKTLSRQTILSKIGTPGFEGYDEQELIDYYTSIGYTVK